MMLDEGFRRALGMTAPGPEIPKPQTVCGGCRQPFPSAMGGEFCPSCAAMRRNPRAYQVAELLAAGLDPAALFGSEW